MLKKISCVFLLLILGVNAYADDTDKFKESLVQIINQLNAITPIINKAKIYQNKSDKVQVHFNSFVGMDGVRHAGLEEDLNMIKKGLVDYINKPSIEPKKVEHIDGDFIDNVKEG